jgi:hypothetical protein
VPATIERSEIEPHLNEMRLKHPLVTDFQAEVVRLIIHNGWNAIQIARHMACDAQRVRYCMEKAHVCAFRSELAMVAVGWDAVLAQHTLSSLLRSKSDYVRLEAAKDLTGRAGLSMNRAQAPAVAVQLNFGVGHNPPPLAQAEPRAQGGGAGRGDAIPPPAAKHGSG